MHAQPIDKVDPITHEGATHPNVASISHYMKGGAEKPAAPEVPAGRTVLPAFSQVLNNFLRKFQADKGEHGQDDVFYIDHAQHNIRSFFNGDFELEGTIKLRHGVLLQGVVASPNSLLKANGTVVIDANASIEIDIECKTLIVLGKHKGKATATDLLVNVGTLKGEYYCGSYESLRGSKFSGMLDQLPELT